MKLHKEILVSIIYISLFIVIASSIIIINTNKTDATTNSEEYKTGEDQTIVSDENHLAGTCPRNRKCTVPFCSLWIDANKDGLCDRGIE